MRDGLIWMALAAATPAPAFAQATAPKPPPKPAPTVGEVVVTGQTPPVVTSIDRRSYSVAGDLRAQSGSIGDALRNLPSVEVDVQGNISLRGDPNVTILIDGKPSGLFRGEGKGQALQALPADRIERVEVITNPSAEFRADGTAGIINLVTKTAKGAGRTGSARLNAGSSERVFANASAGYNGPDLTVAADAFFRHDPSKQAVSEDRARVDAASGAFAPTRQETVAHVTFDILGGRVSADYDVSPRTRLSGELRAQVFEFGLDSLGRTAREDATGAPVQVFDRALRIDQDRANGEITAGLRRKFTGDGHELTLSLSYEATQDERTRDGATTSLLPLTPDAFDRQHVRNSLRQLQLKGDYMRPLGGGAKLKLGFDLQHDDNRYDNRGFRGPAAPAVIPDPTLTNLFAFEQQLSQAYVTYERPIGDLTVLAGLRVEDMRIDLNQATLGRKDENDDARVYPSLHLAWKLSDTQQLTASYSQRVQRPSPDEYNAFRFLIDPLTFRSGNPRLKPQQTQSFELGYQYRKNGASYLATLYYRDNEKVVTDVTRDLGGGVFLVTRDNVSATRAAGLELVANGRLSRKLTYNVSGNAYWNELDATALGLPGKRSGVTASGRASLNWQVTDKDFIQVSGFVNARRLTAQGYVKPTGMLNLGYRRKLSDSVSLTLTAQNVLDSFSYREVIDAPLVKNRIRRDVDTRMVLLGLSWTFGGARQRDPSFDFNAGSGSPSP